jgi:oligopeptide transport system ATP-binding protein
MANNAEPLLKVEDLKMYFPIRRGLFNKQFGVVKAVDDVSFEIERGKTLGLVGESGCGKTTTGKCILNVFHPTSGRITYDGKEIGSSIGKEKKRDIQMIFQDPYGSLDPRQSVRSILGEVYANDGKSHNRQEINDHVNELLETVNLGRDIGDRYPHEMSGGQRQRIGIARSLACNPKLIVCDEPVSALDVSVQAQIINLFKYLQERFGLTYLFIAHDLAVVRHIADKIAVMYLGHIVEMMDADELYKDPQHPYTIALLSAVPTTDYYAEQQRSRIILSGEVPSPTHAPSGCPFHPRCPYATEKCKTTAPRLMPILKDHFVACYRTENAGFTAK